MSDDLDAHREFERLVAEKGLTLDDVRDALLVLPVVDEEAEERAIAPWVRERDDCGER